MKKRYEKIVIDKKEEFWLDSEYNIGSQTFTIPEWYTEEFSHAYKNENNNQTIQEQIQKKMSDSKETNF